MSSLAYKSKENAIFVVEDINFDVPKTKQVYDVMKVLNVADKKTLIIIPEYNDNLYLSTRNVPNIASTLLSDINTYDIINADVLVLTETAAKVFSEEETVAEA